MYALSLKMEKVKRIRKNNNSLKREGYQEATKSKFLSAIVWQQFINSLEIV